MASGAAAADASSLRMARKQTLVSSVTKSKHFPISILHIFPVAAAIFPSTFSTDTHFLPGLDFFLLRSVSDDLFTYVLDGEHLKKLTYTHTRFIRRNLISSTWQTISRALVGLALGTRNSSTSATGDRMLFAHAETVRSVPFLLWMCKQFSSPNRHPTPGQREFPGQ